MLPKHSRQVRLCRDSVDLAQFFFERIKTALLDVGGVHERGVVCGDHSLRRVRLRIAGCGFANQIGGAFFRAFKNLESGSDARAVCRDFGGFSPAAVGVFFEIVAGFDRQIPVSGVDTDSFLRCRGFSAKRSADPCHQNYSRK